MRPRRVGLSVLGLVLIAALPTSAQAGATIPRPDFVGPIGDTGGRVALRVNHEHGRVSSVLFVAFNVRLRCEDGSTKRTDYNIRTAEYLGHGIFDATFGREHHYYRIHGRLLKDGKARGFFAISQSALGSYDVQCSTDGGPQRWDATQTADRRPDVMPTGQGERSNRRTQSRNYVGAVRSDDAGRVEVRLRSRAGRPTGGTFEASNVQFVCESEQGVVMKTFEIAQLTLHFVSPGMFYADAFGVRKGVLASVVSVRGRLNADGQILGPIYALRNPPNPVRGLTLLLNAALGRANSGRPSSPAADRLAFRPKRNPPKGTRGRRPTCSQC